MCFFTFCNVFCVVLQLSLLSLFSLLSNHHSLLIIGPTFCKTGEVWGVAVSFCPRQSNKRQEKNLFLRLQKWNKIPKLTNAVYSTILQWMGIDVLDDYDHLLNVYICSSLQNFLCIWIIPWIHHLMFWVSLLDPIE